MIDSILRNISHIVLTVSEETVLAGILKEFTDILQYACVSVEIDVHHHKRRLNIQILLKKQSSKYTPFLDKYTCKCNEMLRIQIHLSVV